MAMRPSRRACLRALAAGAAGYAVPGGLGALPSPTVDLCATGPVFAQALAAGRTDFGGERLRVDAGAPLAMRARSVGDRLAFEASAGERRLLRPTLVVDTGTRVQVDLANDLTEPTVAHWHGLAVDTRNDGNGEALIAPGARFAYDFTVRNRAGLYWYHPHPHGATAEQVYRGLFGLLEVQDDEDAALRRALALTPGDTELALVVQDRPGGDVRRYAPGPADAMLGWYGCVPEVNGVVRPFQEVAARRYRLRVLNGANARTYRLAFRRANGTALPFHLIGTDGGLLARALPCREVLVSPAERVDLLVDFAGLPRGESVVLASRAFDPMQAVRPPPAPPDPAHAAMATGAVPDGAAFDLMQFRVRESGRAGPPLPDRLSQVPDVATPADDARPLRLGFAKGQWRINDRVYDATATPIEVARGARETWLLRNYHASAPHAMHLHGFHFRVLERETSPDTLAPLAVDDRGRLATDLGWKDTVLVWPGESVRVAIDFASPFPDAQIYLVHCHNLEHEDAGMMLRVRVG
ncbi:MAG: multicopper oxidase domain-containing protein [Burkholderiales bacterium]